MPRKDLAKVGRVLASLVLASLVSGATDKPAPLDVAYWRTVFARPDHTPTPAGNPATPEKVALGALLFEETRLSGSRDVACSSCHQADLSFTDGVDRHVGHDGQPLDRRTPPLWNLAWGLSFFWDGRASSLEAQAMVPIENEREMAGNLQTALREL
ncbi:MAG: cytochrome-c peroxidase, partial [Microvirga sp.]